VCGQANLVVTPGYPGVEAVPGNTLIPLVVSTYVSFTDSIGPGTFIGGNQQNGVATTVIGQQANGANSVTRVYSTPQIAPGYYNLNVNAFAYVANPITLFVTTSLYNSVGDVSSVTGFVDPVISFAPGFDSTATEFWSAPASPAVPIQFPPRPSPPPSV
jgi:hypothetical protein